VTSSSSLCPVIIQPTTKADEIYANHGKIIHWTTFFLNPPIHEGMDAVSDLRIGQMQGMTGN